MVGGVTAGQRRLVRISACRFSTPCIEARAKTGANATAIYVPPIYAMDSIMEAIDAGIEIIVAITDGIPVHDMARVRKELKGTKSRVIGPNCPGIITPDPMQDGHHAGICA